MPTEIRNHRDILDAISTIPSISDLLSSHDGHFDYELDLEVIIYGRNYTGKQVGPYVRMFSYQPGEVVTAEGDWGGNTFFFVVSGALDVFVRPPNAGAEIKVAELMPGTQFGEMSVLAGVPRNATMRAPEGGPVVLLEIQRPALRLLRKLGAFSESLDHTYRRYSKDIFIENLSRMIGLERHMIDTLEAFSDYRVFSKHQVLFQENAPIEKLYIITQGWMRRSRTAVKSVTEDYLGCGYCFGLEGARKDDKWPYSITMMGRAEVMVIAISDLRGFPELLEALSGKLAQFAPPAMGSVTDVKPEVEQKITSSQKSLIETGLVDATNLLVIDMDLCIRCGNCSLACHKIHGQSRLTRKGIHITRLKAAGPKPDHSVLSPSVCMHCQAPECLTGCPTGAIGQFGQGEIDIDPKTCIGCGDCATQCPYDAIYMVPRKAKWAENPSFVSKLFRHLKISPDPLPPAVTGEYDLVAVKCNLCSDRTTLNPPGSKTQAYSCEENCPTGALARVNPKEYFTEIGDIQGLLLLDKTHAAGRNVHKPDGAGRWIHMAGITLTLIVTALSVIGVEKYGYGGLIFGSLNMRWMMGLGGLIGTACVMAYSWRRQQYIRRRGRLKYWLISHSYLGAITAILIFLHGGTKWGGWLTSTLMIFFILVVLTGAVGLLCYSTLPHLLTSLEGSPLLLDELKTRRDELRNEISETYLSPSIPVRNLIETRIIPRFISLRYLVRQYIRRDDVDTMVESAKAEFEGAVSELINEKEKRKLLQTIEAAAMLRRVDAIIIIHYILKLWLIPHIVFTSLMLILQLLHIVHVFYYAVRQ